MITQQRKEEIRQDVQDAMCELASQDMQVAIDTLDLSKKEKTWATDYVDWAVIQLDEPVEVITLEPHPPVDIEPLCAMCDENAEYGGLCIACTDRGEFFDA